MQKWQHCIPDKILDQSVKRAFSFKFYPINFFILFFFYIIFHLFLIPLNILSTNFNAKMATLHYGRNCWPVGTRGIFTQILHEFLFHYKRIFYFFLGPLNMLSASFGAKTTTLYSSQNTWPIGQKDSFVQILPKFFYLFIFQKNLPLLSETSEYYLQVFVQKWRLCILFKILDQSEVRAFSYKFYSSYFFIYFSFL